MTRPLFNKLQEEVKLKIASGETLGEAIVNVVDFIGNIPDVVSLLKEDASLGDEYHNELPNVETLENIVIGNIQKRLFESISK